jgi:hypothetical protein
MLAFGNIELELVVKYGLPSTKIWVRWQDVQAEGDILEEILPELISAKIKKLEKDIEEEGIHTNQLEYLLRKKYRLERLNGEETKGIE